MAIRILRGDGGAAPARVVGPALIGVRYHTGAGRVWDEWADRIEAAQGEVAVRLRSPAHDLEIWAVGPPDEINSLMAQRLALEPR